jgi:protein-disulfide isomerase
MQEQTSMAKKLKASKTTVPTAAQIAPHNQQIMILGGVIAVAIIVLAGFIFLSQESTGEAKALGEYEAYAGIPVGGEFADARSVERGEEVPEGVSMGINEDGLPYIGDPNAPITIGEFADFTCPHCANYHGTMERFIEDFARTGQAQIIFLPIPSPARNPSADNAARAAYCAAEQGAFWEMHDEIFRVHLAESGAAFSSYEKLQDMADQIGLDGDELRSCMNTNRADAMLFTANQLAQELGVNATPTMVYRLGTSGNWLTIPTSEGGASGARDYDVIARLIRQANES